MKLREYQKSKSAIRLVLEAMVLLVLVARLLRRDFFPVFLCVLTLALFNIPRIVDKKLNLKLPSVLEAIVLIFIFCAEILGEIGSFYTVLPWWDTLLHTVNGFLMAAIGFAMIDLLNDSPRFHFNLSPIFVAFVAFCFSMTVGVVWEFFEFGMDQMVKTDMQKDRVIESVSSVKLNPSGLNDPIRLEEITETVISYGEGETYTVEGGLLDVGIIDTMKDLIVNCIGAILFSIVGFFYLHGRNKSRLAEQLIPRFEAKNE
ncbi:MAG: hypothetical protein IJC88_03870 [Oscillospiraceae bacterium]|nr:hypothetical protein [Oscillospiraceae bacterium]